MKPKTLILMGLAITCGLGASYMTSRLLAERPTAEEPEKVEILVAKRNMSVGEPLKRPEELFEKKAVLKESAPPEAIVEFDVLKEKIMKQHLRKGDHITLAELYGNGDSLPIPEGYKAVGLRVSLETTAAGFATLPHSRVNVYMTVRGPDHRTTLCKVLLENVLVLAADQRTDRETGIAAPASVVTFALRDEDVLRVTAAKEMGILSLSLRKPNDQSKAEVTMLSGEEIMTGKTKKEEPKVEIKPELPKPPVQVAEQPKPAPQVEPELPKGKQQELTIITGSRQERYQYRVGEDGEVLEESHEPAPPRPQPNLRKRGGNKPAEDL